MCWIFVLFFGSVCWCGWLGEELAGGGGQLFFNQWPTRCSGCQVPPPPLSSLQLWIRHWRASLKPSAHCCWGYQSPPACSQQQHLAYLCFVACQACGRDALKSPIEIHKISTRVEHNWWLARKVRLMWCFSVIHCICEQLIHYYNTNWTPENSGIYRLPERTEEDVELCCRWCPSPAIAKNVGLHASAIGARCFFYSGRLANFTIPELSLMQASGGGVCKISL